MCIRDSSGGVQAYGSEPLGRRRHRVCEHGPYVVGRLQRGVVWISGDRAPPKAWMELRAARAGPLFVPLEELSAAPASIPLHFRLPSSRTLTGAIQGPGSV